MYDDFYAATLRAIDERPAWDARLRTVTRHPFLTLIEKEDPTVYGTIKSRLLRFCAYQERVGENWFEPQLARYRDYLLEVEKNSVTTVGSCLSTLRCAYRKLTVAEWFRELLYSLLPPSYQHVDKLNHIEDVCIRLNAMVSLFHTPVVYPPRDPLRDLLRGSLFLTPSEINQLLSAPAINTLKGVRDRAIIATLICTGVRGHELVNLNYEDILEDALQVRAGNTIERIIPFGNLKWGLYLLRTWVRQAGIYSGPVFVSIRLNHRIRFDDEGKPKRLSANTVSVILRGYPVEIDGQSVTVNARHLRYMYGHILYSQRVPEDIILHNMGYRDDERGFSSLVRSRLLPEQALLRTMPSSRENQ